MVNPFIIMAENMRFSISRTACSNTSTKMASTDTSLKCSWSVSTCTKHWLQNSCNVPCTLCIDLGCHQVAIQELYKWVITTYLNKNTLGAKNARPIRSSQKVWYLRPRNLVQCWQYMWLAMLCTICIFYAIHIWYIHSECTILLVQSVLLAKFQCISSRLKLLEIVHGLTAVNAQFSKFKVSFY